MPIKWRDEYATGNSVIDFDHKMLINMINDLESRIACGAKRKEIAHVFDQLASYVDKHFAREEGIFMPTEYPYKEEHLSKHQEITKTVGDIVTLYKKSPKEVDLQKVLAFLMTWLNQHILKTDMGYAAYLPDANGSFAAA
ncbi:MAG: bacteriohemerythrin [Magnetovibrionaceae bacterium]